MMMYKVTKEVSDFNVELANNGVIIRYSGRDDEGNWTEDKIVMPDLSTLFKEIERIVELNK